MALEPAAVHCWCCPREKTTRRRGSSSRKTSSWTALASGRTQASRRLGARKLATQRPAGCRGRARARVAAQPWEQEEGSSGRDLGPRVGRMRCWHAAALRLCFKLDLQTLSSSLGACTGKIQQSSPSPQFFLWHGRAGDLPCEPQRKRRAPRHDLSKGPFEAVAVEDE